MYLVCSLLLFYVEMQLMRLTDTNDYAIYTLFKEDTYNIVS